MFVCCVQFVVDQIFALCCFFFNDTATTEIYTYCHTLSLHDALPICRRLWFFTPSQCRFRLGAVQIDHGMAETGQPWLCRPGRHTALRAGALEPLLFEGL